MVNITMDSPAPDFTEEHIKILIQCISKWMKMIEYLNNKSDTEYLSEIESLSIQINQIVSPILKCYEKNDTQIIIDLLENLKISTENLKQQQSLNDDNGLKTSSGGGGRLLLRLSLISSHLNAVVGLHKLLIIMSSDSSKQPCPSMQSSSTSSQPPPPPALLSTNEESLIRLSICHSLRLTFEPLLIGTGYFSNDHLDRLFPSTSASVTSVIKQNKENITDTTFRIIYLIYLQMFLHFSLNHTTILGTVFQQVFLNDCLPILLAVYAIYKATADTTTKEQKDYYYEKNIEERFTESHFQNENIRSFVIRNLFLLLASIRSSENVIRFRSIIANMIRNHLIAGGLELFIDATLDSDLASQRNTTVQSRIQAMVTVVAYLPVKNHSAYHAKLLNQAICLLAKSKATASHPPEIYWTFSAMLVEAIDSQNRLLAKQNFFDLIGQHFQQATVLENLNLTTVIQIVHRMVSRRRCLKRLSQFFAPIFYLRFSLELTICHLDIKDDCWLLLIDMLGELPKSEYVLDDCLGQHQQDQWINRFGIDLDKEKIKIIDQPNNENQDLLDRTNKLATFTLKLLEQTNMSFRMNYFYLLLERLIDDRPLPVILFLIGPFSEKIFGATVTRKEEEERENVLKESERTVQFLTATMERIVNRLINVQYESGINDGGDETEQAVQIWTETLSMCLKILVILLDTKSTTLVKQLKPCHESLSILLNSSRALALLNEMDSMVAHEIHGKFEKLYNDTGTAAIVDDYGPLNMALKDLRDADYVPSRVHALITIKRMILVRDPAVENRFDEIFQEVRNILKDSESYVYLAAIKTLFAMAVRHTDQVLPVLIQELIGSDDAAKISRPLADRLKIGEVLLQLAHSIGDFAYHYSDRFIHGLLCGVKSSEPAIRISALSCLGEFCRQFRFGMDKYIVELVSMAERILATDPEMDCRRAAASFLYHLLAGLDRTSAIAIQDHLKTIKNIILDIGNRTLDDVLQRHCQMAYGELSRIAREFLPENF